jgi:hypothetical protein
VGTVQYTAIIFMVGVFDSFFVSPFTVSVALVHCCVVVMVHCCVVVMFVSDCES